MALSRPTEVQNVGDAWRVTTAAGYFMIELSGDPRVDALYPQWRGAREQAFNYIARAPERHHDAMLESWLREELDQTKRFVREQLGLGSWADWVAVALTDGFQIRRHNERHPDDQRRFAIPVQMPVEAPRGKRPRADGEAIARAARWLYRAEVKQPPDSIHLLAQVYAAEAMRNNDCRSVVQNGVKQIKALLQVVSDHAQRMPQPTTALK